MLKQCSHLILGHSHMCDDLLYGAIIGAELFTKCEVREIQASPLFGSHAPSSHIFILTCLVSQWHSKHENQVWTQHENLLNTCSQLRRVVRYQLVYLFSRAADYGQSFSEGRLECDRSSHGLACPETCTEIHYSDDKVNKWTNRTTQMKMTALLHYCSPIKAGRTSQSPHPRPHRTWPVHRSPLLWWPCCPRQSTQLPPSWTTPGSGIETSWC